MKKIFSDRAGYEYVLVANTNEAIEMGVKSYVTFNSDGTPVVIRDGKKVLSSFFTDGNGNWANQQS